MASADGFVAALPWGLDTRIGEQGLSLSGGQRQRLALARAVLGRPPVLVLDDPLSALDVHTEAEVEAALRRVLGGVTALVVAHRPSTVQLADRVAMLRDGRIAAVGHAPRAAGHRTGVPGAAGQPGPRRGAGMSADGPSEPHRLDDDWRGRRRGRRRTGRRLGAATGCACSARARAAARRRWCARTGGRSRLAVAAARRPRTR